MRTLLGRVAAITALGVVATIMWSGAAGAGVPEDEPTTTSTTSTTTTSTTTTSTTTLPPPLVVEVSPGVLIERGGLAQVTDTLPPPPTTSTLPPDQLPANSGEGRRMVYSKSQQRAWAVEANGTVAKTHRVSGRLTYNQPTPGTYAVFSKSGYTCNIKKPYICWRYMVRFTKGPDGDNIGFHEIPKNRGVPVQSESQLGQPLSDGCIRQATTDAIWVWDWTSVGTKVVVLA